MSISTVMKMKISAARRTGGTPGDVAFSIGQLPSLPAGNDISFAWRSFWPAMRNRWRMRQFLLRDHVGIEPPMQSDHDLGATSRGVRGPMRFASPTTIFCAPHRYR
jgi:hypothetical protein